MMDRLSSSLQESVLTLLALNDEEGRIAAGLLHSRVFDDVYRVVAERILQYRKKHGKAPGKSHLDDVLDDILDSPGHKYHKRTLQIVSGILANEGSLNAKYVLSRVSEFHKKQKIKAALISASDTYTAESETEEVVDKVKRILQKAMKPSVDSLDTGTFLHKPGKVLSFLERLGSDYKCGIEELDRLNVGPTAGELMLFLGAKGAGKSWWAVHMGKMCLLQKAKVVHVTLEMPEEQVVGRYIQAIFAIAKHEDPFWITKFKKDNMGRTIKLAQRSRTPEISLESPKIRRYIQKELKEWGGRLGNLVVKGFPTRSLTVEGLEGYLDMLEMQFGFIPNVLILDEPDLMLIEKKDYRLGVGLNLEDIRGLCQRRNVAGLLPAQVNRKGWDAHTVRGSMIAEDASKLRTADRALIYSQTQDEKRLGLARLYLEKNRTDRDGITVAISQNYGTGQFVMSSTKMSDNYFDLVEAKAKSREQE